MAIDSGYEVGFGRPPKSKRWQKGQSGNPKGRKRKPTDLRSMLEAKLDTTIPVSTNGKERLYTLLEVGALQTFKRAVRGNVRAIEMILKHLPRERQMPPKYIQGW
jgi:hypothetical protein